MKNSRLLAIGYVAVALWVTGCGRTTEQTVTVAAPQDTTLTVGPKLSAVAERYPGRLTGTVRNMILCIGDGMGLAQLSLARIATVGTDGKLTMEQLPYVGLVRTHSKTLTTDSAAAATALATGYKTANGMLGVSSDRTQQYVTILEAAKAHGMSVGLISVSSVTHATPAGFAVHVDARGEERAIAAQMLAARVDVLFGGGRGQFLPQKAKEGKDGKPGTPADPRDLIAEAKQGGYQYVETREQLKAVTNGPVLGLFAMDHLTNQPPTITLAELTGRAIELLGKNPNGFFLMVEGSEIDWECHANRPVETVEAVSRFDAAVKCAADFALEEGHTVVVVTADHETGGLAILGSDEKTQAIKTAWAGGVHSAIPVPLFAFGPKAELFAGVYDNTEVARKMGDLLNLPDFPMALRATPSVEKSK